MPSSRRWQEARVFAISPEPIDMAAVTEAVADEQAGAVATFGGMTRAHNRGRRVIRLEYEAYDEMAVAEFRRLAGEAAGRWPLTRTAIVHRSGVVPVGELSVAIAVSAEHRAEALAACAWLIDSLKHVAPIFKKEHFEGGEVWIGSLADCEHE